MEKSELRDRATGPPTRAEGVHRAHQPLGPGAGVGGATTPLAVPTLSRLLRTGLGRRSVQVLVVLSWWWVGWHFFGWHFFGDAGH
jgi:hypothetical protein